MQTCSPSSRSWTNWRTLRNPIQSHFACGILAMRGRARSSKRQRSVLLLRVYQELPHREIARLLGGSVGAVKANFFHALGNLKRLLEAES